jgi:hypothetical protein
VVYITLTNCQLQIEILLNFIFQGKDILTRSTVAVVILYNAQGLTTAMPRVENCEWYWMRLVPVAHAVLAP